MGKRADVLTNTMMVIDLYTLQRALTGLTQDELDWEPHPGAWGIRRRSECTTADPLGDPEGDWVADNDWSVAVAAAEGRAVPPMTTIGWLLNHIGAAPGLVTEMTILGGATVPTHDTYARMWSHTILPDAASAATRLREGWTALDAALRRASDELLEQEHDGHPWKRGDLAITALLNEVSHHGTQICTLRDLYRAQHAGT